MVRRPRRAAGELRRAIDCMPAHTRAAMLHAIRVNPIIVGAYTDRDGGVCPMLAAHRNGGRASYASFARAWDRYTRAGDTPRRATEREVRTLTAMLEASIAFDDVPGADVLSEAVAEHRRSEARSARRPPEPATRATAGECDRTAELGGRQGWSWLRPFRRLDEYERALAEAEEPSSEPRDREREPALSR